MSRTSRKWHLLLGLAISGACLWIAFRRAPVDALVDALRHANYLWLLPYLGVVVVLNLLRGEVWRLLLKRRCGILPAFWAYTVGFVFNNVLPLRVGEAARILVLAKHERLPTAEVAATAALERILDLTAVVVVLACTVPLVGLGQGALRYGASLAVAAIVAAVSGIVAVGLWSERCERIVAAIAGLAGESLRDGVVRRWHQMTDGLSRLLVPSIGLPAFGGILTVWALTVTAQWMVMRAFQPAATPVEAAFMVAVVSLAIAVPAAPGFIGVYQWAGQQALVGAFPSTYTPAMGLAIAIVAHAVSYLFSTLLGVIGLWYFGASFKRLGDELSSR